MKYASVLISLTCVCVMYAAASCATKDIWNMKKGSGNDNYVEDEAWRRWVRHVTHIGEMGNGHGILVRNPKGKRPLGWPEYRWEDNVMDLEETRWDNVDWIDVAHDSVYWWGLVNTYWNFVLHKGQEISWLADQWSASQEGLCCLELNECGGDIVIVGGSKIYVVTSLWVHENQHYLESTC